MESMVPFKDEDRETTTVVHAYALCDMILHLTICSIPSPGDHYLVSSLAKPT
jgi:hypothetical protein